MKITLAIITILFLTRPVLPVVEYLINYDYITTELCENKANPEMQCNGKCHLRKELAKAAESEKPLSQKKAQSSEAEVLFFQETIVFTPRAYVSIITSQNISAYANLYSYQEGYSHFHPPLVIS
ncbi:MAG: hypothetical protein ACO1N9_08505 [Flavobacterium sp.]